MKFCYINLASKRPARDAIALRGLQEHGHEVIEVVSATPGLKKFWHIWRQHRALKGNYDIAWLGFSSHILVPFIRMISHKKIVFNCAHSLYEGIVVSRAKTSPLSLRAFLCWLIDFFAFRSATVSIVETVAQREYLKRKFFLPDKKFLVSWTGVDDTIFFHDADIEKLPKFTVLFRGGFLPESGVEYVIEAARILKNEEIRFRIIGSGLMEQEIERRLAAYRLGNIEWIRERLTDDQLRRRMQETHVSLGQLSHHPRLTRTTPHKVFESLAMKLPYLTARNQGVLELLTEDENCLCCNSADATDLAEKILFAKDHPDELSRLADYGYVLYEQELTSTAVAKHILKNIS